MSSLFNIAAGGQAGFYDYQIQNSLRFDDGSTANLSKTLPDSGDRQTWTFSAWVKRSAFPDNAITIFSSFVNSQNYGLIRFTNGDGLEVISKISDVNGIAVSTNQVFRDVSSWYHIVVAVDTTQSTSTDRVKMYVNGTQITSFSTTTYPSQNYNSIFNYNILHYVGRYGGHTSGNYDGYMAEVHLIDGQALDPTSFGETKSGVWIPKDTSGLTFGTNGFRLQFGDSAAIGDDTSGNTNDFTATNLSAHDVVPDSPTLNYATLNYLDNASTLSEGNLTITGNNAWRATRSTFQLPSSGKWYFEASTSVVSQRIVLGVATPSFSLTSTAQTTVGFVGMAIDSTNANGMNNQSAGNTVLFTNSGSSGIQMIVQMAVDCDTGKMWFGYNNNFYNSSGSSTGNPSAGTNETVTLTNPETFFPIIQAFDNGNKLIANFGQDSTFAGATTAGGNSDANGYGDFKYAVPSGFLALNSANLPEPDITPLDDDVPEDYFNTAIWTGNGTSQTISGVSHQPDFMWIKRRSTSRDHQLVDTVRGLTVGLQSNLTNAESTDAQKITSVNSDGYVVGSSLGTNANNETYVGWSWLAGGTAVSNTDGSVTSQVSVNSKAGFSIVSFTSPASGNFTAGHGLGVTPEVIIQKETGSTGSWHVWHESVTTTTSNFLKLETTGGLGTVSNVWGASVPNSTTFGLGVGVSVDANNTQIAYCFHSVEGYSKFGSYTGNGSADGTFVYTGFRPAWIMHKRTDSATDWFMFDNRRLGYNPENHRLRANSNDTEADPGEYDILSNGFKIRFTSGNVNASSGTYIYMAFAEMPFKYANAR
jgi:hypothetical protein